MKNLAEYVIVGDTFGPIVYRLGRILLKDKSGVRFSVGSQILKRLFRDVLKCVTLRRGKGSGKQEFSRGGKQDEVR